MSWNLLTSHGLTVHRSLADTWWGHCALDVLWFPTSQAEKLRRTQLRTENSPLSSMKQFIGNWGNLFCNKPAKSFLKSAVTFLSRRDEWAAPSLLGEVDTPGTGRLPKRTVRGSSVISHRWDWHSWPEIPPSSCRWGSDLTLWILGALGAAEGFVRLVMVQGEAGNTLSHPAPANTSWFTDQLKTTT